MFYKAPLGSESKGTLTLLKKQYQGLDKNYEFDKKDDFKRLIDKDKKLTTKTYIDLKYNNFNLSKYQSDKVL